MYVLLRLGVVQNNFHQIALYWTILGTQLSPFYFELTSCFNAIPSNLYISKCNSKSWRWCQKSEHIPYYL